MNSVYDWMSDHPWTVFAYGALISVVNFALGLAAGWRLARH